MAAAPNWDDDGPELQRNLNRVSQAIAAHARAKAALTAADIRAWHADMLQGLAIPEAAGVGVQEDDLKGAFRGPPKLGHVGVTIGGVSGTDPSNVAAEVDRLLQRVSNAIAALDGALQGRAASAYTRDELRAVCQLAGGLHGEWIRIHPFGNGNGRTARLLANWVLMRFGLLPVLRPRPRPRGDYASASMKSMRGQHEAIVRFLLEAVIAQYAP